MLEILIPIEMTASTIKHEGSNFYYIGHIFDVLENNKEYLENPDYSRLHEEAIDYLFRRTGYEEEKREWWYSWILYISHLFYNNSDFEYEKYSIETVDVLLKERKKIWET